MAKTFKFIFYFWGAFVLVFVLDQWVKSLTLAGLRWQSEYLDLTYALNTGVAFSMLSFLEHNLKYLHLALIVVLFIYLFW
ncbi:signal peptidase II, partial [Campylobacter jejuni]